MKQTKEQELEKELKIRKRFEIIEGDKPNELYSIMNYNPLAEAELKGIKEGRTQAISEFKEKLIKRLTFQKGYGLVTGEIHYNTIIAEIEKTAQEIK